VVIDGLRSFVTSQDYPTDLTVVVDRPGETILTMNHTVFRRGGRMTEGQRQRFTEKERVWKPEPGQMKRDISLVVDELWDYLRPTVECPATIDTDEHTLYRSLLRTHPIRRHYGRVKLVSHIRTSSKASRTYHNRLFPVNYVDRLMRHRMKEHTRETIAGGRHAAMQMHRAWVFACDHNLRREYRVKEPQRGRHVEQDAMDMRRVRTQVGEFFTRRIRVRGLAVPESIRRVWMLEVPTPPVRWRVGQTGTSLRLPAFARRDLAEAFQQGW
jgi:hypothetical protein